MVKLGSGTFSPAGGVAPAGKGVKLGSGTMPIPIGSAPGGAGKGFGSPAQDVIDRMSALTGTEETAIRTFVDGLVAAGLWASVIDFWCFALNATDMRTGFISRTAVDGGGTAADAGAQGIQFQPSGEYLESGLYQTDFPNRLGMILQYVDAMFVDTNNSDYCGASDSGTEVYFRYRGTDTNDYNINFLTSLLTPRPVVAAPVRELFVYGHDGTNVYHRRGASSVWTMAEAAVAPTSTYVIHINGRNFDGVSQSAVPATHTLFGAWGGVIDATAYATIRAASLQLMRDLGTTNVPAT